MNAVRRKKSDINTDPNFLLPIAELCRYFQPEAILGLDPNAGFDRLRANPKLLASLTPDELIQMYPDAQLTAANKLPVATVIGETKSPTSLNVSPEATYNPAEVTRQNRINTLRNQVLGLFRTTRIERVNAKSELMGMLNQPEDAELKALIESYIARTATEITEAWQAVDRGDKVIKNIEFIVSKTESADEERKALDKLDEFLK